MESEGYSYKPMGGLGSGSEVHGFEAEPKRFDRFRTEICYLFINRLRAVRVTQPERVVLLAQLSLSGPHAVADAR